jgi:hypothetical protein
LLLWQCCNCKGVSWGGVGALKVSGAKVLQLWKCRNCKSVNLQRCCNYRGVIYKGVGTREMSTKKVLNQMSWACGDATTMFVIDLIKRWQLAFWAWKALIFLGAIIKLLKYKH